MKSLISRLTMKLINKEGFRDIVSGDYVKYWIDCFGVEWMAVNKFGFRTKSHTINRGQDAEQK